MRKVLFVCTAKVSRSPTAEDLFQGGKGFGKQNPLESCRPTGNLLTQELVDWADPNIVMEPTHSEYITSHFQCSPDKIRILNIADRYSRDDPEVVSVLQKKVPPILKKN